MTVHDHKITTSMQHQTDSLTTSDGLRLFTQSWLPSGEPRAHLLIVHGYAEHSSRYQHLAAFLNLHGIAVYSFDLRGHGQSEGKQAYVDRFELYLKDLTAVLDRVRLGAAKKPVFLFGHSMGGAIVTMYVITRQPKIDGVILSGPALKVSEDISPLLQSVSSIISAVAPKLKTIKLDATAVSRDPEVVKKYLADPLVYTGPTYARTGAELLAAAKFIGPRMEQFRLPVLIMHGTADRLTDPEGSKQLYGRAATPDKELKLWEGLYHELVNEPEKKEVMDTILAWMEQRIPEEA